MHLVNNKWTEGLGDVFVSKNPFNDETVWSGKVASSDQIDQMFLSAKNALKKWRKLSLEERCEILNCYAENLRINQEQFAEIISQETGKPFWESKTEVNAMVNKIRISIKSYIERTGNKVTNANGTELRLFHKPHGILGVFGPFNFPAHLPNGHIIPALIAGNVVIFKPSELTPKVGEYLVKILIESGIPPGVISLIQGKKNEAIKISEHKLLDGLLFTGSAQTGLILHQKFGSMPDKLLALELGGNNPLIVTNDFDDFKSVILMIVQSAFITSGQRCTCARRVFIPKGNKGDDLLNKLVEFTQNIKVAGPFDNGFLGTMISADAADAIVEAEQKLLNLGGRNLVISRRLGKAQITPSMIDVTEIINLPDEEYFGPLLQVIRYDNFEDAVDDANDTKYGLSAGIITNDNTKWEYFLENIRAGIINRNKPLTGASSDMPFGGVGISGNHRPSAYYAADYCAYPVSCMVDEKISDLPTQLPMGLSFKK
ncbi:N-succinylglutamate 5-semialdehyde dehydrogenase [Paraphotobacterium marinum]